MKKVILFILVLIILLINPVYSQNETKINWTDYNYLIVAVLDFDNLIESEDINSKVLVESFQSELVNKSNFAVVERNQIEKIIKEQEFQSSSLADKENATNIGLLVGAQKIITGILSKINNRYILIIKGIDVESGVIEISDQLVAYSTNSIMKNVPRLVERFLKKASGELLDDSLIIEEIRAVDEDELSEFSEKELITFKLQISSMIENKEYRNPEKKKEIQGLAIYLDHPAKFSLYHEHKLSGAWLYAAGNSMYGLGSWIQGDFLNGAIVTGTMVGGMIISLTLGGYIPDSDYEEGRLDLENPWGAIGFGLMAGGMIYGWVIPFLFQANNNRNLKDALLFY